MGPQGGADTTSGRAGAEVGRQQLLQCLVLAAASPSPHLAPSPSLVQNNSGDAMSLVFLHRSKRHRPTPPGPCWPHTHSGPLRVRLTAWLFHTHSVSQTFHSSV